MTAAPLSPRIVPNTTRLPKPPLFFGAGAAAAPLLPTAVAAVAASAAPAAAPAAASAACCTCCCAAAAVSSAAAAAAASEAPASASAAAAPASCGRPSRHRVSVLLPLLLPLLLGPKRRCCRPGTSGSEAGRAGRADLFPKKLAVDQQAGEAASTDVTPISTHNSAAFSKLFGPSGTGSQSRAGPLRALEFKPVITNSDRAADGGRWCLPTWPWVCHMGSAGRRLQDPLQSHRRPLQLASWRCSRCAHSWAPRAPPGPVAWRAPAAWLSMAGLWGPGRLLSGQQCPRTP